MSFPSLSDLCMSHDPASRGYSVLYREREINHCPGCGRTHWYIGRQTAECAFCSTALPLEASLRSGTSKESIRHKNARKPKWAS